MSPVARSVSVKALSTLGSPLADQVSHRLAKNHTPRFNAIAKSAVVSIRVPISGISKKIAERATATLRSSRSFASIPASTSARAAFGLLPRQSKLLLRHEEREQLDREYGADLVGARLRHDVFADVVALRRQLAHETKTEITLSDYRSMAPFALRLGQIEHGWTQNRSTDALLHIDHSHIKQITERGCIVGEIYSTTDGGGQCRSMTAKGRFGVPEGWMTEDELTVEPNGVRRLCTVLTGPNGESGMIERSFDGSMLTLERAYKSTLPTRISGVPDFNRPVSTINFLTARALNILGITDHNLTHVKVNRLQHLPTLAHLDWLQRNYPGQPLSHLIDHTTWAKTNIRETAAIVGQTLEAHPQIDMQGGSTWMAAHPGTPRRRWRYLHQESIRLTIEHLTGQTLPEIDDPSANWRVAAEAAKTAYKQQRCAALTPDEAQTVAREIDTLLKTRLDSINQEEAALRQRYDIAAWTEPRQLNFDVTYRTTRDAGKSYD